MFILPFLLYTYMSQQNFSNYINETVISDWTSSSSQWFTPSQWVSPAMATIPTMETVSQWFTPVSEWLSPKLTLPSTPDMAPYAAAYFLSGAMFFLGSTYMLLSARQAPSFAAIDGISTMSDFTKTRIMKYMDEKPSRELVALISSNGMKPEEFLNILSTKRTIH